MSIHVCSAWAHWVWNSAGKFKRVSWGVVVEGIIWLPAPSPPWIDHIQAPRLDGEEAHLLSLERVRSFLLLWLHTVWPIIHVP